MSNLHSTRRGGTVLAEAWVKGGALASRNTEVVTCSLERGISSGIHRRTVTKLASGRGRGRCNAMRACILRRNFSSGG